MFNTLPAVSPAVTVGSTSSSSPCVRLSKSRQPLSVELGFRILIVSDIQYSGIRITLHGAIQCFQEPISWSEQLPCARVTALAWTNVFLERFSCKFLILQTSQPKPTDLKMIFFCLLQTFSFPFWYLILRMRSLRVMASWCFVQLPEIYLFAKLPITNITTWKSC